MKRLGLVLPLFLIFTMYAVQAIGQTSISAEGFKDGNYLYETILDCEKIQIGDKTGHNYWSCGFSMGYILSVSDTHDTMNADEGIAPFFCKPSGVVGRQLRDVVHLYLKNNPAKRNKFASATVLLALSEAWPCPKE